MKRPSFGGLLALNAALLAALAAVTFAPRADARQPQSAPPARARGQYTMVTGNVQGRSEAAIYVVDAGNLEVLGFRYDNGKKELSVIGRRDLAADSGRSGPVKPR